ncbi:hypothetical protein V6Z11_D09G047400 [Gossypium hirsutum]
MGSMEVIAHNMPTSYSTAAIFKDKKRVGIIWKPYGGFYGQSEV